MADSHHASVQDCLAGGRLVDRDGKPAGEICDLLLDCRSGHIDFVCVAVEPPGIKDRRYVTIPWSALSVPANDEDPWAVRASRKTLHDMARYPVTSS